MNEQVVFLVVSAGFLAIAVGVEVFVRSPWPGRVVALLLTGYTVWLAFGRSDVSRQDVITWVIGVSIVYAGIHGLKLHRAERDRQTAPV